MVTSKIHFVNFTAVKVMRKKSKEIMRIGVGLILSEIVLFDWPEKRFWENI